MDAEHFPPPYDADIPAAEAAPTDTPAERDRAAEALEIARLADLDGVGYSVERKAAAQRLGMGMVALDKAVQAEHRRRRTEAAAEHRAKAPPAQGEVRWPYGIVMRRDGLHADAGEAGLLWLAAPFEVLGEARDAGGDGWGLWLRWQDRDEISHTWPMPARLLMTAPGELEAALVERGLRVSPDPASRMHLRRALGEVQAGSRVTLVARSGWHAKPGEAPAYVLPDGAVIGAAAEAMVLRNPAEAAAQMVAEAGTLEEWQRAVAALAVGNDTAVLAMSAAFAGPLLDVLGEASGGLHLFGKSKTGKTLALRMALSVWGLPFKGGALRDWRSTANGLEGAAEECGDGLLGLDELHQADPREVASSAYMLANESGKGRMRRDTSAARRRTWRTFILSTGELDLASMVAKAGQKLPAGAEVRLPSIPMPSGGLWPNQHRHASVEAFMTHLHAALRQQHGTAIRAFLVQLAAARTADSGSLTRLAAAMQERMTKALPIEADAQVRDVARRFALVALAGELATAWGVLPWPRDEAARAAKAMLAAWVGRRGGSGSSEEAQHLRAVRLFLVEHGASRFVVLHQNESGGWYEAYPERPVARRAGWRRKDAKGQEQYLIPPVVWREVCAEAGVDPTETARTLRDNGMLEVGDGKNMALQVRIPGMEKVRCYCIPAEIVGDTQAAEVAA
jgi:putative DNA primase/helicase